jgi:transcriptional regulator with XRE-family HTH domain
MDTNQFLLEFGSILQELCKAQNKSKKQVSGDTDTDYQHQCKWMKSGNDIKLSTFLKYLLYIGITPRDLHNFIRQKVQKRIQEFEKKKEERRRWCA